jgi:hypothetical protein
MPVYDPGLTFNMDISPSFQFCVFSNSDFFERDHYAAARRISTPIIDVSGCMLTFQSIEKLFQVIANCGTAASLVMRDLNMPDDHCFVFFDPQTVLPPFTCVQELDWSGSRFPEGSVVRLVKSSSGSDEIHFLGVDGLFSPLSIPAIGRVW